VLCGWLKHKLFKGRLWYLVFCVAGASVAPNSHPGRLGEWLIALGLDDHSPATWVDARLSIMGQSPPSSPPPSTPDPQASARKATTLSRPQPPKKIPNSGKQRPLISVPIRTSSFQISPSGSRELVVSLEKFSETLQNEWVLRFPTFFFPLKLYSRLIDLIAHRLMWTQKAH
jgi:hypothetical protein